MTQYIGVPDRYVAWVEECIPSPSFSVALNGSLVGYFQSGKDLRQGDPLSPFLFVLGMEVLSRILLDKVQESMIFKYHPKCKELQLTHLCFTDDLIFTSADADSVRVIQTRLGEFSRLAGLCANSLKSEIFFGLKTMLKSRF